MPSRLAGQLHAPAQLLARPLAGDQAMRVEVGAAAQQDHGHGDGVLGNRGGIGAARRAHLDAARARSRPRRCCRGRRRAGRPPSAWAPAPAAPSSTGVRLRTIRPGRSRTSFSSSARLVHSSRSQCTLKSLLQDLDGRGLEKLGDDDVGHTCLPPPGRGVRPCTVAPPCPALVGDRSQAELVRGDSTRATAPSSGLRPPLPKGRGLGTRGHSLELQALAHLGEHLARLAPCRCRAPRAGARSRRRSGCRRRSRRRAGTRRDSSPSRRAAGRRRC